MKQKKLRQALAVVALVFMGIFTVTFVITLVDHTMYNGVFGYISLVSVLLGVGLFLIIKYVLKDKTPPEYLPQEDPETQPDEMQADTSAEQTTAENVDEAPPTDESEQDAAQANDE